MDDEKGLPKSSLENNLASVSSLMKEVLGPHAKYSNTLVQYVHEIANGRQFMKTEFINKVGDEANKKCIEKDKTKISIDDVKQTLKVE